MADKERRMVTLCEHTPESTGKLGGRGPALWAFGFEALAKLLGISVEAARRAVREGRLDPADLEMVCESWMHYHPGKARQFVADLDWRERDALTAKTPEEKEVLAMVRAERERRRSLPPPDQKEEARRMVERCKEAPIFRTGPTPGELVDHQAKLGPEVMGDILARCAAGNHVEAKCRACGQQIEEHTLENLRRCMASLDGPYGPGEEVDQPDPDVPF